jgi:hypothetical protein
MIVDNTITLGLLISELLRVGVGIVTGNQQRVGYFGVVFAAAAAFPGPNGRGRIGRISFAGAKCKRRRELATVPIIPASP